MGHPIVFVLVAVFVASSGALFAWQAGLLDFSSQGTGGAAAENPKTDDGAGMPLKGEAGDAKVCPAVCVQMWRFNSVTDECRFVECGSGCGPDDVETFATKSQCESNLAATEEEGSSGSFTPEEYKAKPTLCQSDADCKVIPITCNQCDCGRAVNVWIEPYACTTADKANSCGFVCPASKAVCEAGVCKKVEL